jgi:hypothetical protein
MSGARRTLRCGCGLSTAEEHVVKAVAAGAHGGEQQLCGEPGYEAPYAPTCDVGPDGLPICE